MLGQEPKSLHVALLGEASKHTKQASKLLEYYVAKKLTKAEYNKSQWCLDWDQCESVHRRLMREAEGLLEKLRLPCRICN
jgi:hypothetical protein